MPDRRLEVLTLALGSMALGLSAKQRAEEAAASVDGGVAEILPAQPLLLPALCVQMTALVQAPGGVRPIVRHSQGEDIERLPLRRTLWQLRTPTDCTGALNPASGRPAKGRQRQYAALGSSHSAGTWLSSVIATRERPLSPSLTF